MIPRPSQLRHHLCSSTSIPPPSARNSCTLAVETSRNPCIMFVNSRCVYYVIHLFLRETSAYQFLTGLHGRTAICVIPHRHQRLRPLALGLVHHIRQVPPGPAHLSSCRRLGQQVCTGFGSLLKTSTDKYASKPFCQCFTAAFALGRASTLHHTQKRKCAHQGTPRCSLAGLCLPFLIQVCAVSLSYWRGGWTRRKLLKRDSSCK